MNLAEIQAIFDQEVRRECEWTRMRRDVLPHLVRYTQIGAAEGGGIISWSDLTGETVDAAIQSQIDYFGALHVDFEWKCYSYDLPADLPDRLLARGFVAQEPEALMVVDIEGLPAEYWNMDVSAVQPVTTPGEVDEIARMENEVWGGEEGRFASGMKEDLRSSPASLSIFAIWKDGRVVSAGWTYYLLSTQFATLWGGSTLEEYRKHGYYTALLAVRAREARQRGFRFLQVDASPNSQPILARHGFQCLGYSTPYKWSSKGAD